MNSDQKKRLSELFSAHAEDSLTPKEQAELQAHLRNDSEARHWWFVHQDVEIGLRAQLAAEPFTAPKARTSLPWLSWRPLTAAAAGIMLGMLCTSVVFGFVGQRHAKTKTPLALVQPSFEDAQMPLAKGFPPAPSLWTGDVAKVVTEENGVIPKDGHRMLRLETTVHGAPVLFPRLYQVIAIPPSDTELREIEVSASFASADPSSSPHYSIRAYAVAQAPQQLGPDWFNHRGAAIATAATGFDSPPDPAGWQSFGLRILVPSKARSLVVFFGVKNQAKSQARQPHYLDAVQVSLVESPRLP